MAGCVIGSSRGEACKDSLGGIQAVYFFNYGEATFTVDTSTGYLVSIAKDDPAGGSVNAYRYVTRHQSDMTETIQASPENGTVYFDQAINLVLKRLSGATSKEVKLMAWGRPQIVVHDNNGKAWLAGYAHGCDVSGGTITTGVAKGDLSGYTINFLAQEKEPSFEVTGSTIVDPFASAAMQVDVVAPIETSYTIDSAVSAGTYAHTVPLVADAKMTVTVTVTTPGPWSIAANSVPANGYVFAGSGTFLTAGTATAVLQGTGTPTTAQTDTFTVKESDGFGTGTTTATVTVT